MVSHRRTRRCSLVSFGLLLALGLFACDCGENGIGALTGELWIGRTNVDFGRVCIGDEVELAIDIENRGAATLQIEEVRLAEGGSADLFGIVEYPEELEREGREGSKGHIVISFEPTGPEQVNTRLYIETDERDNPERELRLEGSGDDGPRTDVVFTCAIEDGDREVCNSVMLGEIGVGAVGQEGLVLENRGCAELEATDVDHFSESGNHSEDVFTFEAPEVPFVFSNRETAEMELHVRPEDEDAYVSRFEVTWKDFRLAGSEQEVAGLNVIAQGVDLQLVIQPSRGTFGQATIDTPQTETFSVRNLGAQEGEVTSMELRDGVEVFSIEPHDDLPAVVPGLGEILFDVTYAPMEAGRDNDVVLVHTQTGTLELPVTGGAVPQIVVDPATVVDFGFVEPADTVFDTVTVSNEGRANLELFDIVFDMNPAGVFWLEDVPEFPLILAPSEEIAFEVWFEDNVSIPNETGQISIYNDDPGYVTAGYILELRTENEMIHRPDAELDVYVEGELDTDNPVHLETGETVTFDASGSAAHDGSDLTFSWQIRTKPGAADAELSSTEGSSVTLEPDFPGDWQVRVDMVDRFGLTNWESANLLASDPD